MRIVDIREKTGTLATTMRNAFIDFSQMTVSLVAVVTDVVKDGKPVVGYGFNANGRYAQGGILRERLIPRILKADPKTLLDAAGGNIDPFKVFAAMMTNEKPGGHGDRAVAVAALDMAVWDATAKIAGVLCGSCWPSVSTAAGPTPRCWSIRAAATTNPTAISRSSRTRCKAISTTAIPWSR